MLLLLLHASATQRRGPWISRHRLPGTGLPGLAIRGLSHAMSRQALPSLPAFHACTCAHTSELTPHSHCNSAAIDRRQALRRPTALPDACVPVCTAASERRTATLRPLGWLEARVMMTAGIRAVRARAAMGMLRMGQWSCCRCISTCTTWIDVQGVMDGVITCGMCKSSCNAWRMELDGMHAARRQLMCHALHIGMGVSVVCSACCHAYSALAVVLSVAVHSSRHSAARFHCRGPEGSARAGVARQTTHWTSPPPPGVPAVASAQHGYNNYKAGRGQVALLLLSSLAQQPQQQELVPSVPVDTPVPMQAVAETGLPP